VEVTGFRPSAIFIGKGAPEILLRAGAERRATLERFLDPVVITTEAPTGIQGHTRVVHVPAAGPALLQTLALYTIGSVMAIRAGLRRSPVAIVCQDATIGAAVVLAQKVISRSRRLRVCIELHGEPTASTLYGSRFRRLLRPIVSWTARWGLRNADRVRTISEFTEKIALQAGFSGEMDRYRAFQELDPFHAPMTEAPKEPTVLFVGALEPVKGIDVLLDAWPAVVRVIPEAKLVIVGTGSLHKALTASRVVRSGSVEMLGHVTDRYKLVALIDSARVIVVPSRSEGLSRVVLEARYRGRVVIASAVGGLNELIDHRRTGVFIPPGDGQQLSESLIEVLTDPALVEMARDHALSPFAEEEVRLSFPAGIERLARWIGNA
jgi:glycosyltransferase involved in cell wall biosynthesis